MKFVYHYQRLRCHDGDKRIRIFFSSINDHDSSEGTKFIHRYQRSRCRDSNEANQILFVTINYQGVATEMSNFCTSAPTKNLQVSNSLTKLRMHSKLCEHNLTMLIG